MQRWCALIVVCALAAGITAQRTWIVDAANGPGTHFTDLPPAEAVAADGDTLLVRPGNYSALATSKGIAVLGDPTFQLSGVFVFPALSVSGLPSGRVFRARGLFFDGSLRQSVDLTSNLGAVHLESVNGATVSYPGRNASITISSCRVVTIVDCGHRSTNLTVHASASRVSIVQSRLVGSGALSHPLAGSHPASTALNLGPGAIVDVADCELRGGNGVLKWPFVGEYWPSSAAVTMSFAALTFRAGTTGSAIAGTGANTATPMSAITGSGFARIDPRIMMTSYAGAPLIDPRVNANITPTPGLSLTGGAIGSNLVLTHNGEANQACVLACGVVGPVLTFPFGELFLDLPSMQILPFSFADGSGVITWTFPVPANPAFVGQAICWQVASDTGGLMLSNLASVILR